MPNTALIPELAKLLLAVAWADGTLHPEEEQTLKEVIGLLPTPSFQQWAIIELYLLTPVTLRERDQLLNNVKALIRSPNDKRVALDTLNAMVQADGGIDPQEAAVAQTIHSALETVDVSPLSLLRSVVARPTAPPRERMLAVWQSNPVLYLLQAKGSITTADPDLEITALATAIMAQVVRVTPATAEQEHPIIVHALVSDWNRSQTQADALADVALELLARNIDFHRIARELGRRAPEAQRVALLHTLFAIANAADNVAPREIDEIRVITDRLNLTQPQFIAAKLTIPSADRSGL